MIKKKPVIAIIGLGYVGLPLAVAFSEKYLVIGFDIDQQRIDELKSYNDQTLEVEKEKLKKVLVGEKSLTEIGFFVTSNFTDLGACNVFIVTVPTPTDKYNRPVLTPMIKASETVASVLKKGDIVIYESTVYPGVTEDEMVPILEKASGLKFNEDFFCGYSPERINPGDKEHTVTKILKVTSGSTPEIADYIDNLYRSVILAGTHKAPSIKVAEAAKVIENAQRDINIAFVNELAKIFSRLNIDTSDVLDAAATKWNFLKFKPGLVGGHCIGVDPYYLAQKAIEVGYNPEIILAGRRINDGMGDFVANEIIRLMIDKEISIKNSKCLMLGITFKENCPDVRNTKVIDIISSLSSYGINVSIVDPLADPEVVKAEYGYSIFTSLDELVNEKFDLVVLAVAHSAFLQSDISKFIIEKNESVVYDVKGVLSPLFIDKRL
jgi:UDP-N-acetyl-D-galactosamine dehydrogenase